MTDEKKPNHNNRFYPNLSQMASGKEGVEVNPELSGLFQRFMDKLNEDPSFGVGSHPTLKSNFPLLEGGLKRGELFTFFGSMTGPYKSDVRGYLYRQKVNKSMDLKAFIEKGEGTATEMENARHQLESITAQLKAFEEYNQRDISGGLFVSPLPDDFDVQYSPDMPYLAIVPPGEGMPYKIADHQKEMVLECSRRPGRQALIEKMLAMTSEDIAMAARRKPFLMDAMMHAVIIPKLVDSEIPQALTGKKEALWKLGISHGKPIKDEPKKKKLPPSGLLTKLIGRVKE